ncbi:MAG TPA: hypothetical protein VLH18_01185 [Candidatus Limnocylindrales bacterium]|nr:hypothetical protein [Candidatus Limnocylindrales bacterium]
MNRSNHSSSPKAIIGHAARIFNMAVRLLLAVVVVSAFTAYLVKPPTVISYFTAASRSRDLTIVISP